MRPSESPIPALWQLGFRPFFLLGCIAGGVLLLLWVLALAGYGLAEHIDSNWHAHEMVYGFAVAIIIGFLYTASQNWTGVPGIRGSKLLVSVTIWLLGRVVFLIPGLTPEIVAVIDLAFLPVASFFLASYLLREGQRHNLIFLGLLGILWIGNVAYHLDRIGLALGAARVSVYAAVNVVVTVIIVVSGRVIPFFTERAIQGYVRRQYKYLDITCVVAPLVFTLVSIWQPVPHMLRAVVAFTAAVATGWRLVTWFDKRILQVPILWILYVGYAWLVAGFVLAALAVFHFLPESTTVHAFTAGSISTMIIGMVSRVSLGHTGRPIKASRVVVTAYGLVITSGLLRVFGPMLLPSHYFDLMMWAGGLWVLAVAILVGSYGPILLKSRPDGKPG